MTALLKLYGLWKCITEDLPTTESGNARKEEKALSRIILSLDKSTYPHVMQASTAKEAWIALETAFEDKGLHRRLRLLRSLCSIKLQNFPDMEGYVNEVMTLSQQLLSIGKPLDDEFLGVIMLQGLTEDYEPMVMALENSGVEITADFVKTKLLQDKKWYNGQTHETALVLKGKPQKSAWCWNCKQKGHYKNQCPHKHNDSKVQHHNKFSNKSKALIVSTRESKDAWFIDSGASSHMTGSRELLYDLNSEHRGTEIYVANNSKLHVDGTGCSKVRLPTLVVK